jgi:hypothetical protein
MMYLERTRSDELFSLQEEMSRDSVHSYVEDSVATFVATLTSLRLIDGLELAPLVASAVGGTVVASSLKYFFGKDDWIDVAVQSGLIYANYDGSPAAASLLTLWSVPIAYVSKVLAGTFVSAGIGRGAGHESPR